MIVEVDSKNIFIACSAMIRKANWMLQDGSEWTFVGDGDSVDKNLAQRKIETWFEDESLYFVTDRHKSKEISKGIAAELLAENQDLEQVTICDKKFSRFMVFSYLGVAKEGKLPPDAAKTS